MVNDSLLSRITVDPQICHGKPCIRGLRYPVELLLELMSSGMTAAQILADYPDLEMDDLHAACAYGAKLRPCASITWYYHQKNSVSCRGGFSRRYSFAAAKAAPTLLGPRNRQVNMSHALSRVQRIEPVHA